MEIELKSMMKDHNASLMSGEAGVEQRQNQLLPCGYLELVLNFSAEMGTQLENNT